MNPLLISRTKNYHPIGYKLYGLDDNYHYSEQCFFISDDDIALIAPLLSKHLPKIHPLSGIAQDKLDPCFDNTFYRDNAYQLCADMADLQKNLNDIDKEFLQRMIMIIKDLADNYPYIEFYGNL